MITERTGNLLEAEADALVNTVNTVGVMGKGIALQFKKAFPDMFKAYKAACDRGEVNLGTVHVFETGQMSPRYVLNFPTKGHWRARSRLDDIETGLKDLVATIEELDITSIAVPPLGCGHGGLEWDEVRPRIVAALEPLSQVEVLLYPPAGAPAAADIVMHTTRPKMTPGRAALVALLHNYGQRAAEVSLIEVQKLMYFLQEAGQPLKLRYAKDRYGPYADNLRHVLHTVEGHFLMGYGDASKTVHASEPIRVLPDGIAEAAALVESDKDLQTDIDRVLTLVEGFESAYALELLATVHWVTTREVEPGVGPAMIAELVAKWNRRKARMFGESHVTTAWEHLGDEGWLQQPSRPAA